MWILAVHYFSSRPKIIICNWLAPRRSRKHFSMVCKLQICEFYAENSIFPIEGKIKIFSLTFAKTVEHLTVSYTVLRLEKQMQTANMQDFCRKWGFSDFPVKGNLWKFVCQKERTIRQLVRQFPTLLRTFSPTERCALHLCHN